MEKAKVYEQDIVIPTYEVDGEQECPMFLEKRVYQGSSGKVYPYKTIEKISDKKTDKKYKAVYLENRYLQVMILPELGGRIQRAYDKTNGYDFVYYNHVIKPALVGLLGPWISGGIEFNWPQHHRPTTYMNTSYKKKEYEDGSVAVLIDDVDEMYGTKSTTEFRLYEDRAYIEINGRLYNRTPFAQTFLWWANPAVAVNEHTKSVFPPDVYAVMDHGKRDVSSYPIANGVYYKHDYSEGVDISQYKNIPVPTSYMACRSEYDFVGGYDYGREAGILHIADHHISPGKKQWTWGCGDFGKAWDRNLTDEDGPYIELMTGVFTDNQPDFTWLAPFEEKVFTQYFMPYKGVGVVKNATVNAAVNMEVRDNTIDICIYTSAIYNNAKITIYNKDLIIYDITTDLYPEKSYMDQIKAEDVDEYNLRIVVSCDESELVSYKPCRLENNQLPEPAKPIEAPEKILSNEELYLAGLHIEQYRHATYSAEDYYLEGLKRDNKDARINNAYGLILFKRGMYEEAECCFDRAIERITMHNPNPYDSETYYNRGILRMYMGRDDEAYDDLYKACWSDGQKHMSYYYLAAIDCKKGRYRDALMHIEQSLINNQHNIKARGMKKYILRMLGQSNYNDENDGILEEFDYVSINEKKDNIDSIHTLHNNCIRTAIDYAEYGAYKEALDILKLDKTDNAMVHYYKAYYMYITEKNGYEDEIRLGEKAELGSIFPITLNDMAVLELVCSKSRLCSKAYYYLGNIYYDKKRYKDAYDCYKKSAAIDDNYNIIHRNLALYYYNVAEDYKAAIDEMEKAFALDNSNSRIFMELDSLYKRTNMPYIDRLDKYNMHLGLVYDRDDLLVEYVTLLNTAGRYEEAYNIIVNNRFHPWEGGEGKISNQYRVSLVEMAKDKILDRSYESAVMLLQRALIYPKNIGEGKLEGCKDNNIYLLLGLVSELSGGDGRAYYDKALLGSDELTGIMYYNDQPADMMLYRGLALARLGRADEAKAVFNKMIEYGSEHMNDHVKIEYFAVSLPDLQIFNENLDKRNCVHCHYVMSLGLLGLNGIDEAKKECEEVLRLDNNHQEAVLYGRETTRDIIRRLIYGEI